MRERDRSIDDIPSPWLGGVLDEFFDGKLAPLLETNRGCPSSARSCVQGVRWYTKVHLLLEGPRARRDRLHRAAHPARVVRRWASCGSPTRTTACSSATSKSRATSAQRGSRYGWPTYIDATTGKNRPERVIQSLEKANAGMVIYSRCSRSTRGR